MTLQDMRDEIRRVDEEMAALFVRRMKAAGEIAAYKKEHGLPVEDLKQEAAVIEGRSGLIEDPELQPFYVRYLQHTMDVSKEWQRYLIGSEPATGDAPDNTNKAC